MAKVKSSFETSCPSPHSLTSSVIAQNLSFLSAVSAFCKALALCIWRELINSLHQILSSHEYLMGRCEHLYTHIIQLFILPRGKVVPPYGRLNKEGVIKLRSSSLSQPLYIQILAQDVSDILGLLIPLERKETSCCGFFSISISKLMNIAPEVIIYFSSYHFFFFLIFFSHFPFLEFLVFLPVLFHPFTLWGKEIKGSTLSRAGHHKDTSDQRHATVGLTRINYSLNR
jgi:hypothetical protein